jgi:hypothetical protein
MQLRTTFALTGALGLTVGLASCKTQASFPEPPATTYAVVTFQVAAQGASESVTGAQVSADFFTTTQVRPLLGRSFVDADFQPGKTSVVVLQYDLWQRLFQGRPDVIGTVIQINGRPATVVAVAPRGVGFPAGGQLWVPMARS